MKQFILYLLVAVLAFGAVVYLTGGQETSVMAEPTVATEPAQTVIEETATPTTEPEEIIHEGTLYLTISSMTFSVPGETEDIYCGSIPREEIIWTSGDESVVTVDNGIITSVGVGQTTITAQYRDQYNACQVGCLAASQEELKSLTLKELNSPRKFPPVIDREPCSFFDDAAIIGDSVSYSLFLWGNQTGELGDVTFLVRGGNSINGYVQGYKKIGFQGKEYNLHEAVAASGVKKIFFMMGANDLAYMTVEQTIDNIDILMDWIFELCPDMEVYIESCLPVWDAGIQGTKNADVEAYNVALEAYAAEKGFHYVEVASYVKDHTGGMAAPYCSDFTTHMNFDGTDAWMQALKLYALTQMEENTK